MNSILFEHKSLFDAAMDHLHKELSAIRTGRATPALVEDLVVPAYGSNMELKGVASIGVQDAKTIIIDPWDKTLIGAIEKAIRDSGTGLSPSTDGGKIRINMPSMTEENRLKMVKLMKEKLEEARIAIRSVREDIRATIIEKEKNKEMGEDEKFKLLDELDKLTKEYSDLIGEAGASKEAEVMTI